MSVTGHRPVAALWDLGVSANGFVFDPRRGQAFALNESGAMILDGLRRGANLDEIAEDLVRAFAVAPAIARRAVSSFARRLERVFP